ncbi:MAG: trypsin-like peptidase domain-containing protein [Muribaculaceae bacterium]|nr:trypsin-like peptidase domain-containing protein [Muribaculaceae bacterium]
MKIRNLSLLILFIGVLLTSCNNKKAADIEEEMASGVVLIQNKSFYEVRLSNNSTIYFKGFDEDGDLCGLTFDKDSIQVQTGFGTGFFISEDGKIATNAHVISDIVDDNKITRSVDDIMDAIKTLVRYYYNELSDKYDEAYGWYQYANYSPDVSYDDFYKVKALVEYYSNEMDDCRAVYNELDRVRISNSDITYHNEVSIGYNNTHVTNESDLVPCVVLDVDKDHDLGIIQLKSKATPAGKKVFEIPEEDPIEAYSIMDNLTSRLSEDKNDKLYMTSYNLGPALAITKEGIKSQFNHGSISQKTEDRLMYSIPALHGSSGSPVVNQKGELVAINFASLSGTQNFNYGIRVKYLKNLINK